MALKITSASFDKWMYYEETKRAVAWILVKAEGVDEVVGYTRVTAFRFVDKCYRSIGFAVFGAGESPEDEALLRLDATRLDGGNVHVDLYIGPDTWDPKEMVDGKCIYIPKCKSGYGVTCEGIDCGWCIEDQEFSTPRPCEKTPPIPCPIMCVCMGTPLVDALGPIRQFRDKVLAKCKTGRKIVSLYYQLAPIFSPIILKMRRKGM